MEMSFKKKKKKTQTLKIAVESSWTKGRHACKKMKKWLRPRIDLNKNQQHMTLKIMCTALINESAEQDGGKEKSFNQPNVLGSQRGLIRG